YALVDESETWEMLDEANRKDWKKFYDALKLLYPGCDGNRHYTRNDLENLCSEQLHIPICTCNNFGLYYQSFLKISKFLITQKKLTELKSNKMFLEGIHETANASIRRCLEIKLLDHHPDEQYPMAEVYAAAVFLLPRTAAVDGNHISSSRATIHNCTTTGGWVLTCVLNQGAKVIVMLQSVQRSLRGVPLCSDYQMTMESVNTSSDQTLGVMENFLINFGTRDMLFQVQIVPVTAFDILLGRPFFMLTSCKTADLPNRDQDIMLTDANNRKIIQIP
ncbi:hypothetical protein BDR06DRAFT_841322, partial [Suillus hirtellus]